MGDNFTELESASSCRIDMQHVVGHVGQSMAEPFSL